MRNLSVVRGVIMRKKGGAIMRGQNPKPTGFSTTLQSNNIKKPAHWPVIKSITVWNRWGAGHHQNSASHFLNFCIRINSKDSL